MAASDLEQFTFVVPSGNAGPGVQWAAVYSKLEKSGLLTPELDEKILASITDEAEAVDPLALRGGAHDKLDVYSVVMREGITLDSLKADKEAKGDDALAVLRQMEMTIVAFNRNPYPVGTAAAETWTHAEVARDPMTFRLENQRPRTSKLIQEAYIEINGVSAEEKKRFRQAIG